MLAVLVVAKSSWTCGRGQPSIPQSYWKRSEISMCIAFGLPSFAHEPIATVNDRTGSRRIGRALLPSTRLGIVVTWGIAMLFKHGEIEMRILSKRQLKEMVLYSPQHVA
ncbi:MAG: hypothetical protein ACC619_02635, partial [Paracoccaceae bacterium]